MFPVMTICESKFTQMPISNLRASEKTQKKAVYGEKKRKSNKVHCLLSGATNA